MGLVRRKGNQSHASGLDAVVGQGAGGRPNGSRAQRSSGILLPDNGERGRLQEVPCGCQPSLSVLATKKQQAKNPGAFFKLIKDVGT